jgi:hypothetical protein
MFTKNKYGNLYSIRAKDLHLPRLILGHIHEHRWSLYLKARRKKYLLTFIVHFTKYADVYPIQDQTAETFKKYIRPRL